MTLGLAMRKRTRYEPFETLSYNIINKIQIFYFEKPQKTSNTSLVFVYGQERKTRFNNLFRLRKKKT